MSEVNISLFFGDEHLAAIALFGLAEEMRAPSNPALHRAAKTHIENYTDLFNTLAHLLHVPPEKLQRDILLYIRNPEEAPL